MSTQVFAGKIATVLGLVAKEGKHGLPPRYAPRNGDRPALIAWPDAIDYEILPHTWLHVAFKNGTLSSAKIGDKPGTIYPTESIVMRLRMIDGALGEGFPLCFALVNANEAPLAMAMMYAR